MNSHFPAGAPSKGFNVHGVYCKAIGDPKMLWLMKKDKKDLIKKLVDCTNLKEESYWYNQ